MINVMSRESVLPSESFKSEFYLVGSDFNTVKDLFDF